MLSRLHRVAEPLPSWLLGSFQRLRACGGARGQGAILTGENESGARDQLGLRPTDREREAVAERMKQAFVAERLNLEDLEAWSSAIYAAGTTHELASLARRLDEHETNAPPRARRWLLALVVTLVVLILPIPFVLGWASVSPPTPSLGSASPHAPEDPMCRQARNMLLEQEGQQPQTTTTKKWSLARVIPAVPPGPEYERGFDGRLNLTAVVQGPRDIEPPELFARHRFMSGYARSWIGPGSWTSPDGKGAATASVYEFATPEKARRFNAEAAGHACALATELFVVADLPGSLGMQILHGGLVQEQVTFVRDNRRFEISWQLPDPPPDPNLIETLSTRTAQLVDDA